MKVVNKKYILIGLIGIIILGLFLINNKSNAIKLDEVNLKKIEQEKGMFAIMLQKDAGSEEYTQSENEAWPSNGYEFNSKKSGCLDSDGEKIEDVEISYDAKTNKIRAEVDGSSYCYIYFDIELSIPEKLFGTIPDGLKETPGKGDLEYRYVGTQAEDSQNNINNYLCFGDNMIANAILDRLLHHSHVISITGKSYRTKDILTNSEEENE